MTHPTPSETEPVAGGDDAPPPPLISGRAYLHLVLLGAAIGVPAAVVAALFLALVHDVEHWLWHDLPDGLGYASAPWYLVIGLPVVGALVVVAARALLPGDGGHEPLEGLATAPTPVSHAPGVALAALGTLSFGAVLGPEAPIVALGSVVGVAAARLASVGKRGSAVLSAAGEFSAISALFGGPIVAGMLLVEGGVAMGAALLPLLLPGFVAAAIGYLVFIGFGSWGGLDTQGLVVPNLPLYDGAHVGDLAIAIVVGVLAAVIVAAVRRLGTAVDGHGRRVGMPALLLGGGLAVGLLAELADVLGANPLDVLFSGQASIPAVIDEDSTKIILILVVAKFLAYGVSLGCGFRGGPIFPAIFLGIALASLTEVWFGVSPTLAVAVGTAAGMAAQTRLIVTPVILSALLVGSQGLDTVPAAVLATASAWLAMALVDRRNERSTVAVPPTPV
ncbi:MAG TPA: chloride channel protein [Gaiella sp.]|nr:chloride channel protein [Gaiella sp.]